MNAIEVRAALTELCEIIDNSTSTVFGIHPTNPDDPQNYTIGDIAPIRPVECDFLNKYLPDIDYEEILKNAFMNNKPDTAIDAIIGAIKKKQHLDKVNKAIRDLDKPPVLKTTTPSPFDNEGAAVIGNNPPCHVLFEAIAKGGKNARNRKNGWKERDSNPDSPVFRDPQRVKGDWTVYFDANSGPVAEQWRRVEGLSALHTKLGLFFLAKICDPRNNMRHPTKEPTGVSYEDIRRALGLKEKPMAEFKKQADALVKDLADLKATVRNIVINGKPDGIAECSLFIVSKVWDKQFEFFDERAIIGWLIDPGQWAKYYFNQRAKPWLATLRNTILEIDHRDIMRADTLVLHIATLLFVVAGGDQFKEQTITRTVAELLELAGELPEPEYQGKNWANRTRQRLETALQILLSKKLAAAVEYGPTYPDPGECGKGWVEHWLSATITLTSPEAAAFLGRDVPELVAKLPAAVKRKRKAPKPEPTPPMERLDETTAARLRAGIAQRFVNQTLAAEYFGCSQSALSRAANGINAPKRELAAKIQKFMDSLDTP